MIPKTRALALAEAFLVTFLWSTSYVLVKMGLREMNPLAFATYRYVIASIILILPVFHWRGAHMISLDLRRFLVLLLLGFTGYFLAQGLQFFGLYYLPAVTVTFILDLTPIFVLFLGIVFLKETPSISQFIGIAISLAGLFIFFANSALAFNEIIGVILTFISGIAWATYMTVTRYHLREKNEDVVSLTAYSMAFGSIMLLGATILTGNTVQVSFDNWIIILYLSIVNTALAFALWNHALKTLRAYEQSILQNTMLIQIALLAHVFLNEALTTFKISGIIMVFVGVLIVQLRSNAKG